VVQPHRFTRLGALMDDFASAFNDADMVFALPVYTAGEAPIDGVSSDVLSEKLRERGHRDAASLAGPAELAVALRALVQAGDLVVCLGAGDITKVAAGLAAAVGEL
jgi:UDP-N-acetylmuramate--alanine ligase